LLFDERERLAFAPEERDGLDRLARFFELLGRLARDLPPLERLAFLLELRLAGFEDRLLEGRRLSASAAALVSAGAAVVAAVLTGAAASSSAVAAPSATQARGLRALRGRGLFSLDCALMIHPRIAGRGMDSAATVCPAGQMIPPMRAPLERCLQISTHKHTKPGWIQNVPLNNDSHYIFRHF